MSPRSPAPPLAFSPREEVGPSKAVAELAGKAKLVAKSDFTVIILGETGCGKEIVARAVHCYSPRFEGPLVAVDCGAIPEPLPRQSQGDKAEAARPLRVDDKTILSEIRQLGIDPRGA